MGSCDLTDYRAPFVLTDALVTLPAMVLRDGTDRGFQLPGGRG